MSDHAKLQRQYDALVTGYVLPLLSGGTVNVDQPVAPGAIRHFEHTSALDGVTDRDIFDRLHRAGSAIARIETVPWPDRDLLLCAMIGYDLLTVTDPKLDRLFARGARKKVLGWVDEMLDAVRPPETRAAALARHALLDPLPALRRKDIIAKSWAYTYRFIGRPTTSNLLTRPVFGAGFDETERLTDVATLFAQVDEEHALGLSPRLRHLLARSPVTELVRLDLCPDFGFGLATLAVLSDDAIRGGVAREVVERGEWKAAARLGRALGDPRLAQVSPALLYAALALCFEVQVTATLDVPGPGLPTQLDLTDPDVARYAAVLPAFFDDETMLDEVRAFDALDRSDVQDRCATLTAALPRRAIDEVAPLVRRAERSPRGADPRMMPIMEIRP